MNDQKRRAMPLFGIGIVTKLTELTARQVRYYEKQDLIHLKRMSGNQRLFSFNDVDRLLEIKSMPDKGLNIAGINLFFREGTGIPGMSKANTHHQTGTKGIFKAGIA